MKFIDTNIYRDVGPRYMATIDLLSLLWPSNMSTCLPRGSIGVNLGTDVRNRFSKLDPFRVVTGAENGTRFKS
jgi:hypothetical protein